jgi:HEPN domain-containing protein
MSANGQKPGDPADWIRHALSDLTLAKIEKPENVLWEELCFHAQQAAEKALKAVLILNGITFQKTHSIRMLVDLLPDTLSIPETVEEAVILTDYAVLSRYPAEAEPVEDEEYKKAVQLAEQVVTWAQNLINL